MMQYDKFTQGKPKLVLFRMVSIQKGHTKQIKTYLDNITTLSCTDDRGNTYGTTSMNLITRSGVLGSKVSVLRLERDSFKVVRENRT